jgi:hypothetical protein
MRQEQQQNMLRGLSRDMMPQQYQQMMMRNQAANGSLTMDQANGLRQKAIQNNNRGNA